MIYIFDHTVSLYFDVYVENTFEVPLFCVKIQPVWVDMEGTIRIKWCVLSDNNAFLYSSAALTIAISWALKMNKFSKIIQLWVHVLIWNWDLMTNKYIIYSIGLYITLNLTQTIEMSRVIKWM